MTPWRRWVKTAQKTLYHLQLHHCSLLSPPAGHTPKIEQEFHGSAFVHDSPLCPLTSPFPQKEIAEPLFHLKLAMEQLAASQTFRYILATVLTIGNFLNGCKVGDLFSVLLHALSTLNTYQNILPPQARGFELSYLSKLSQVRDTHTRQPLLHHVCLLLLQLRPDSSDLHSDIAAVTKAAKVRVHSPVSFLKQICNLFS